MKLKISFFLLSLSCIVEAQVIRGIVVDQHSTDPIAFLSVGIEGTPIGTITEATGHFELTIPDSLKGSKLTFYGLGYERRDVPMSNFTEALTISMKAIEVALDEFVVERKGQEGYDQKELKTGSRSKGRTNLSVSPKNPEFSGAMIASRVSIDQPHFLNTAAVYLYEGRLDTVKLRLRIFEVETETGAPGQDLLVLPIVKSFAQTKGWLQMDLTQEYIYLEAKEYFLAFELIEEQNVRKQVHEAQLEYDRILKQLYKQGVKGLEMVVSNENGREVTHWENSFNRKQKKRYGLDLPTFTSKFELANSDTPGMFRSSGFDRWRSFGNKTFRMKLSYEVLEN